MHDPSEREVVVYLPPGYDASAARDKRYPVVFVLAGYTGRGSSLLNAPAWSEGLDKRLDRLIGEGKVRPLIAVMPDCFTRLGGSQYLDSSATGRYETYLIKEIVPWVDETFRTVPDARHRAIVGKSSGGYGAVVHGMKHPDVFGAVACHSGDATFEYCYLPDFPRFLDQARQHGGVRGFVRAFHHAPKKTHALIQAMNVLAMASCYSPNPRATETLGIDLPFDLHTGALRPAVWTRWLRHDPVRMAPRYARNLRKLRFLFLDCGWRDEFNLLWGARMLSHELTRLGVRHTHREFDDGHMDVAYRYDVSLPLVSKALG
jgi:enterochelin esterase family protein